MKYQANKTAQCGFPSSSVRSQFADREEPAFAVPSAA